MSLKVYSNNQQQFNELSKNPRNCEDETLDYKIAFHFSNLRDKLELVKDIVSFANTRGGIIVYGVSDRTYEWEGLNDDSDDIDENQIRSYLDKYVGEPIGFQCGKYKIGFNVFYMITIEKNKDVFPFVRDGEYTKTKKDAKKSEHAYVFRKGDQYGRIGSSCREISNDLFFVGRRDVSMLTNLLKVEPPYRKYVERKQLEENLLQCLGNHNIRHVRINGLGGIGKTSFVRNLCDKIYKGNIKLDFKVDALIWITGKLDFFNPDGQIITIRNSYLTFREMLETFCDVLLIESEDYKDSELEEKVKKKLEEYPSIIVFDNMETISDSKIHDFYKNLPIGCHVIFTSRTDLTTYYTRIDITGFDKGQFTEYIQNSIEEFRPDCVDDYFGIVNPYIDELRDLTGGSPILINFIMCKICGGSNVSQLLSKLRELEKKKKDINGFYNNVMNFCFNDAFEATNDTEKKLLFAMSIPVEEDIYFDISDLSYILKLDEYAIDEALKNIYSISFCAKKNEKFTCPLIIRAFVDKKITEKFSDKIDCSSIANNYYKWLQNKQDFEKRNVSYYDRIKAYDFKRKLVASEISTLKNMFETYSFNEIISKFDEIIDNNPQYSLPYFEKAKYLKEFNEVPIDTVGEAFKKAIEYDPNNDYYLSEYAFFLSKNKKKKEAVQFFKMALSINPDMPNINHGLANCLATIYNIEDDTNCSSDEILSYFEKGYVKDVLNIGDKIRYCGNAHAHAAFLLKLKRYNESLSICSRGLDYIPNDKRLLSLKGNIMSILDPSWISDTKIRKNKKGIFSSLDDEKMSSILRMIEDKK